MSRFEIKSVWLTYFPQQDSILMAVRGDGLAEEGAEGSQTAAAADGGPTPSQKVVYVLHPNCAIEEY